MFFCSYLLFMLIDQVYPWSVPFDDGVQYDEFYGEPDLMGWETRVVRYIPQSYHNENDQSIDIAGPSRTSTIKFFKEASKMLNMTYSELHDPNVGERLRKRLTRTHPKYTREMVIRELERVEPSTSGRAIDLDDSWGLVLAITGPTPVLCLPFNVANEECYPRIGCFGPKSSLFKGICSLPERRVQIKYELYKKNRPWRSIEMNSGGDLSDYDRSSDIVIFLHGFFGKAKELMNLKVKDSFLKKTSYHQVILVDYEQAVRGPNYLRAFANAELIGRSIGQFIIDLKSKRGLDPSKNVYIVGFSLGYIISNVIAWYVHQKTGLKIKRLTALDPPGPFTFECPETLLTKNYVHFMDTIHTSAGYDYRFPPASYLIGKFGVTEPIGHVDFYANGGGKQNTCEVLWLGFARPSCSHMKALEYFLKSFGTCEYKSIPCDRVNPDITGKRSCIGSGGGQSSRMGFYADTTSGRGSHYVEINGRRCG